MRETLKLHQRLSFSACWTLWATPGKVPEATSTGVHSASGQRITYQKGVYSEKAMIEAVEEVVRASHLAQHGNAFSRKMFILATLDVKNVFNSLDGIMYCTPSNIFLGHLSIFCRLYGATSVIAVSYTHLLTSSFPNFKV